jgi:hypothetical protein
MPARTSYRLLAVVAAALGTYLLYDARPGLNWGIWVAFTAAGLLASRAISGMKIQPHTWTLLGWAIVIAFGQAVTAVPEQSPLIFASVALLLGLAVITLDASTDGITLPAVVQVPFVASGRVAKQAATDLISIPANARGLRNSPRLRGALLAIPLIIVLALLLSTADPLLDSVRITFFAWLDNWQLDGRVIFFAFLFIVVLGAYALSAGTRDQRPIQLGDQRSPFLLGDTEIKILLGAMNAVLWVFVLLQLLSLTRNPGATAGTGITYAEYARRGFAELCVASAIVLAVILFADVFRAPVSDRKARNYDIAAIVAVELILASAFRRVVLYEAAYGYTTDRLIAQAYMLVLGLSFISLGWDLRAGQVSAAFGRRGMTLTLAAVTVFTFWNYQGWLVDRNLHRPDRDRHDIAYVTSLSPAAVPALVAARSALTEAQRNVVDSSLRCVKNPKMSAWYEWNLRREQARSALRAVGGQCVK